MGSFPLILLRLVTLSQKKPLLSTKTREVFYDRQSKLLSMTLMMSALPNILSKLRNILTDWSKIIMEHISLYRTSDISLENTLFYDIIDVTNKILQECDDEESGIF